MNCIAEETAMMYADGELSPAEARLVEAHLPQCTTCRDMIALLRGENVALTSYLRDPAPNRRLVTLGHLAGSIAASMAFAVPMQWIATRVSDVSVWANYVAALPFEIAFRALRTLTPLLVLLVIVQVVSPAMTRRGGSGGAVVITSQETIQDSVLVAGDTVLVEGKIEGNLYIFGRSLEVRGEVDGDVIAGGQEVRITGHVTGNVMAGAESISVSGHVNGNLYAGGRNVHVDRGGSVDLEVLAGGQTVTVEGTVGRSLSAGGDTAVIAGTVGRGIAFGGNKVLVRSGGKIGGDIKAEVPDRNNVQVESGASVGGKVDIDVSVKAKENPWTKPGTYVWELAVLAGAFLVGWLLMTAFPRFFAGAIREVPSWASAGFGFVVLIVTPIAAVILCVILIGIPVAVAAVFLYLAGLYLAKIVVGAFLGRELIASKNETGLPTLAGLLAGLVILQAVFFVPYAGGILKFAVLCLGLGTLVLQTRRQVSPAV